MRLEDLRQGIRVRGIVAGEIAHILGIEPVGPDAVRVVYALASGDYKQRLIMRADEPELIEVGEHRTPFDADPEEFKLAAEALRIRMEAAESTIADGRFRPLPHQLDAVYNHLLPQIPLRFLLADDPGAGKTIMAGLFLRELQLRSELGRCLIVAPGSLVEQWQSELREKFGLEFAVLGTEDIKQVKLGGSLYDHQRQLIIRMDQVARDAKLVEILRKTRWGVVVVDEAHRMSAHYGKGNEVVATKRYRLGEALRGVTQHFLLMTATPHAGKEEDFQLFMRLIDPDRFEGRYRQGEHRPGAEGLMLRRSKEDLLTLEGKPLFPRRAAYTVSYGLSAAENELYEAVTDYVRTEFDRADQLVDKQQRTNVGFALTVLQRRLASGPLAIELSLGRRRDKLMERLAHPDAARKILEVDAVAQEFPASEREEIEEEFAISATAARTPAELRHEIAVVSTLFSMATAVREGGADRKWAELQRFLQAHVPDSAGKPRKIIVFTEHKDTLDYLVRRCQALLGDTSAVVSIHGGLNRDQRLAATKRFTDVPQCRVLVATDAAGEGLNLQVAHLMVNYDLPWNPNRLEQRFGRIHRIGQTEMCHLWNLVADGTREGAVYKRLLLKLDEMKDALGGKIFDILGELFEEVPLHRLLIEAIRKGDSPEVRAHLETVIDEGIDEIARRLVEEQALSPEVYETVAPGTYQQWVQQARARRVQPHYAAAFFTDAFKRFDGKLVAREPGRWEIPHIPGAVRSFAPGEVSAVRMPRVCFDPAFRDGEPEATLLGPGEPLFNAVRALTEKKFGRALLDGTVLIDRLDFSTTPRLLAAVAMEISDGNDAQVAARFHFVEYDERGRGTAGPARFLDYDEPTPAERALLTDLTAQPWLAQAAAKAAEWTTAAEIPAWYASVKQRQRARVDRVRRLTVDRLKQELDYWAKDAAQGRPGSTRPYAEIERLTATLASREADLDRQEVLQPGPARVLAVALVVPQGLLESLSGRPPVDTTGVEQRAVEAVLAAERGLGRVAEAMPHDNPGFDIMSFDPATMELIFIEVKGRIEGSRTFHVTNHEIQQGRNAAGSYRLALVEVNPAGPHHDIVRYVGHPFDGEIITALVKSLEFSWSRVWGSGRTPY